MRNEREIKEKLLCDFTEELWYLLRKIEDDADEQLRKDPQLKWIIYDLYSETAFEITKTLMWVLEIPFSGIKNLIDTALKELSGQEYFSFTLKELEDLTDKVKDFFLYLLENSSEDKEEISVFEELREKLYDELESLSRSEIVFGVPLTVFRK